VVAGGPRILKKERSPVQLLSHPRDLGLLPKTAIVLIEWQAPPEQKGVPLSDRA
jgi:hypothetical protein